MIDRIQLEDSMNERITRSVQAAMKIGKGVIMIHDTKSDQVRHFSSLLMCPTTGISYSEPEPNTFSFNSPYGACSHCNGLGEVSQIDLKKVIPPDVKRNIRNGGLAPLGEYKTIGFSGR